MIESQNIKMRKKILQIYSYFFAVICLIVIASMFFSFVLGGYTVFSTKLGITEIANPITFFSLFIFGVPLPIFTSTTLGEIFSGIWSIYLILFVVALNGPKLSVVNTIQSIKKRNRFLFNENAIITVIVYFSIMLIIFSIIELIQNQAGIPMGTTPQDTPIRAFTMVSIAPIVEEVGFRTTLIGGVVFFILLGRSNNLSSLKALWHPSKYLEQNTSLHPNNYRWSIIFIILLSGFFFGASHLAYGSSWAIGKLPSAIIAGILLGWIYFTLGFPAAVILHWSFNFLPGAYVYFECAINISIVTCNQVAESSLLINAFQALLLITGVLSIGMVILNRYAHQ